MNVLLSAVGRRAYLVEYFKQVVHPLGGKVYTTNTHPDATGFVVAGIFGCWDASGRGFGRLDELSNVRH